MQVFETFLTITEELIICLSSFMVAKYCLVSFTTLYAQLPFPTKIRHFVSNNYMMGCALHICCHQDNVFFRNVPADFRKTPSPILHV